MDLDAAVNGLLERKDQIKAVVMVPTYRQAAAFIKRIVDGRMNPIFTSVSFVNSDALAEALKELGPKYADGVIVTQVVPFFGSRGLASRPRLTTDGAKTERGCSGPRDVVLGRTTFVDRATRDVFADDEGQQVRGDGARVRGG